MLPRNMERILAYKGFTVGSQYFFRGKTFNGRPLHLDYALGPFSKEKIQAFTDIKLSSLNKVLDKMKLNETFEEVFEFQNEDEFIIAKKKNLKVIFTDEVDNMVIYVRIDKSGDEEAFTAEDIVYYGSILGDAMEAVFTNEDLWLTNDTWKTTKMRRQEIVDYQDKRIEEDRIKSIKYGNLLASNRFEVIKGQKIEGNRGWGNEEFRVKGIYKTEDAYLVANENGEIIGTFYYKNYRKIKEENY